MRFKFLTITFLLCSAVGFLQPIELKHLGGNAYLNKAHSLKVKAMERYLKQHYKELNKDKYGLVETFLLDTDNDTLCILHYDSLGIKYRLNFKRGKRADAMRRNDTWSY